MNRLATGLLAAAMLVGIAACEDDGTEPEPPFTLTFSGDASFQGAHGGQTVMAALVETSSGDVVETAEATVSATADPSFTFSFADALAAGTSYEVHYWIDSNFGGGAEGVCDPKANDHQWRVAIGSVTDDEAVVESHTPAATEDVCATFAADLMFSGDASFQGAHGGQGVSMALVRASDGAVLLTRESTVSSDADPSFSFDLPNALLLGAAYEVHYWIDSNFGGGTEGTCDPPSNDHQWSLDIAAVTAAVDLTDTHRPTETEDVCASFAG